jgi:hypothetical protein
MLRHRLRRSPLCRGRRGWFVATKKVARPQPDPKAVASMALGGFGSGRSTTSIKEATTMAAATADNKDAEVVAAKEAMTVR